MNIFKDDAAHPFLIEPITLAHDLTLYCSIRFMSSEYPAHEPLNISPNAEAVLNRDAQGVLLIDLWTDEEGTHNIGSTAFTVGREIITLDQHSISGDWTGAGLLFLMLAMAQNLMGWSRYVVGVNDLGGW